jgi:hypothetical protein
MYTVQLKDEKHTEIALQSPESRKWLEWTPNWVFTFRAKYHTTDDGLINIVLLYISEFKPMLFVFSVTYQKSKFQHYQF